MSFIGDWDLALSEIRDSRVLGGTLLEITKVVELMELVFFVAIVKILNLI